jgi:FkbM family methyltransferase
VDVRLVRHYVSELDRPITVALDRDEADAYQSQFEASYPFPMSLSFLTRSQNGVERFVDVGANIGQVTLVAAALGIDCLAIEPQPRSYLLLCESLAANGFTNARPIHAAASDRRAVLTLLGNSAWSYVVEGVDAGGTGVAVPALPLDALLPIQGFAEPDLVKIDVEGHEASVIRGLEATIRRCKPLIVVESNTWMLGGPEAARRMLRSLEDLGYAPHLFLSDGSVVARSSDALQPLAVADYLAIHRDDLAARTLPNLKTLSLEEELELQERELASLGAGPGDLRPRLLHLTHSISDLERRADASSPGTLTERIRRLASDPAVESMRRENWTPPHWPTEG